MDISCSVATHKIIATVHTGPRADRHVQTDAVDAASESWEETRGDLIVRRCKAFKYHLHTFE